MASAKCKRIEAALEREGLREYVDGIEDNRQSICAGEVVLWMGSGYAVYGVKEAVETVRRVAAATR